MKIGATILEVPESDNAKKIKYESVHSKYDGPTEGVACHSYIIEF